MAIGAPSTTPRRAAGQDAMTSQGKGLSTSPQDEARIQSLLQAAGRAHQAANMEKLQAILEEILEIEPDHARATYNLGILHRDRNDILRPKCACGAPLSSIRKWSTLTRAWQTSCSAPSICCRLRKSMRRRSSVRPTG